VDDYSIDLMSRQNPNRYGMDVSRLLPLVNPDYCCDIDEEGEEEDSGECSSPVTPMGPPERDPGFRPPVYSMRSSTGSYAYNFSPWSPRRSNDFSESITDSPPSKDSPRTNTSILTDLGRGRVGNKGKEPAHVESDLGGLGIKHVSVARPTITFVGPAMHDTYLNLTNPRRAPAPPPLKLHERALADSYVKTPYPSRGRHMSIMSQKSVFEDNDDDENEGGDGDSPDGRWRRKDSSYSRRFSGLGDFTQSLRRSSIRMSMSQDVQEIIPAINTTKHRAPPSVPAATPPTSTGGATAHELESPSRQSRRTISVPAPSKVKTMLLRAKRSLNLGLADESKREKKGEEGERSVEEDGGGWDDRGEAGAEPCVRI